MGSSKESKSIGAKGVALAISYIIVLYGICVLISMGVLSAFISRGFGVDFSYVLSKTPTLYGGLFLGFILLCGIIHDL